MNGEDQRVAARIILEDRLGRRVGENSTVPIELAVDADGRERRRQRRAEATQRIGVRPGLSDTAVFLGITKILLDNNWYDADFVRRFTDFPLLVRTDTLRRLQPQDVQPDYKPKDISGGPSYKVQGLKDEQRAKIGDF